MFLKNSRYYKLPTHTTVVDDRPVALLNWRRLPTTTGEAAIVKAHDQLDALAEQRYADAARYWHIADANSALQAHELTELPGSEIQLPKN
ncbi:LysM domain-containing protein [Roseateles sp.]|uniref:LysM domain-containing protein n=1 Tax=Roseateles sp. TaxID=1971397 RepID=UPI00326694E1